MIIPGKTTAGNSHPGKRNPMKKNQEKNQFKKKVLAVTRRISNGKTLSYKQVAELAGRPKAYRAVGNILNKNYNPEIPCHRVIRSNGEIGGYNRGNVKKKQILEKEKAEILKIKKQRKGN